MTTSPGTVLVTGASTGIGAATVRHLTGQGRQVIAGVRREEDATALKSELGERVVPVQLDITDPEAVAAAAVTIRDAVGAEGLAGLVNNAGIAVAAPLEFLPPAELRRQLDVNVVGQVAVTQAVLPLLRDGHGRIVNVGSVGDRIVAPLLGAYTASKFALAALTGTLRIELAPWGIDVILIEPGAVTTPIWQSAAVSAERLFATLPPAVDTLYGKQIAAARAGAKRNEAAGIPPAEVAKVIVHALTTQRPRTRYLVGRDAHIAAAVARLPPRLRDRFLLRRTR
ncbi:MULTISPECIES: SDR family oxidoreductase [Protofrankia]|uniref:Retinol dehydrogenase n=1 Tax=Candidatus Protofrankia datiscae TaxID=2716812 RepID=F8B3V1_9ACTN|nr:MULTISPECIES: SDR family oxidoreductase [Protofrankia]AEH09048.1 Retinol dehydrogenase [Candidatus Protofrankia datiscae]